MEKEISATHNDVLERSIEIAMARYQEEKNRLFFLQEKVKKTLIIPSLAVVVLGFLNAFSDREKNSFLNLPIGKFSVVIYGMGLIILFIVIVFFFYKIALKGHDYKTIMGYKFFVNQINENDPIKFNQNILKIYIEAYAHNSFKNEELVKQIQRMNYWLFAFVFWTIIGYILLFLGLLEQIILFCYGR